MSFLIQLIARSRTTHRGLDDGLQTLDAAYRKQMAALGQARARVVELVAAEKRLEIEAQSLAAAATRYRAEHAGDIVGAALTEAQRDAVLGNVAELRRARLQLESMLESVRLRVELFRTEKLAAGVRYVAARAASRSGMSVAGLIEDVRAIERLSDSARERFGLEQERSDTRP